MRTSPRLLLPAVTWADAEYLASGMLSHSKSVTSTASILMCGLAPCTPRSAAFPLIALRMLSGELPAEKQGPYQASMPPSLQPSLKGVQPSRRAKPRHARSQSRRARPRAQRWPPARPGPRRAERPAAGRCASRIALSVPEQQPRARIPEPVRPAPRPGVGRMALIEAAPQPHQLARIELRRLGREYAGLLQGPVVNLALQPAGQRLRSRPPLRRRAGIHLHQHARVVALVERDGPGAHALVLVHEGQNLVLDRVEIGGAHV